MPKCVDKAEAERFGGLGAQDLDVSRLHPWGCVEKGIGFGLGLFVCFGSDFAEGHG